MDYYEIERTIIAICMLDVEFESRIDRILIQDDTYIELLEIAKELRGSGKKSVTLSDVGLFNRHKNLSLLKNVYDRVFAATYDLENKNTRQLEEEYDACIFQLQDISKMENVLYTIEQTKNLVLRGKYREAITNMSLLVLYENVQKLPSVEDLMKSSLLDTKTFRSGIKEIDNHNGGLFKGSLSVILGDTGTMKTMISMWLCHQMLVANPNFKCLYFEKEMDAEILARRLVSNLLMMKGEKITKYNLLEPKERVSELKHIWNAIDSRMKEDDEDVDAFRRLTIVPSTTFHSVSDMYTYIRQKQADIWCLDYATLIKSEGTKASQDEASKEQAEQLNNICLNTNTFGMVLSQIKHNSLTDRRVKIPTDDDMEYGKHLKQKSSYTFSTFIPWAEHPNFTSIHKDWYFLAGQKNRHLAPIDIPLIAKPAFSKFMDPLEAERLEMLKWLKDYKTGKKTT